ncbi:hypothetical protein D9758_014448 [Tetrapyrgos nigripes]|uniref:Amidohydrolase-related domain-containing protein n=1 Tax=Tetrapyrgos nigripes TaxID=182062 RepID=A0A8H5BXC7_9AGAR|nr:hypothetical protein D9758_014448 [Tetrapyrgos nigripes]
MLLVPLSLFLSLLLPSVSFAAKDQKRGISFPANDNAADIQNLNQSKSAVTWQYDWGIYNPFLAESGIEYVPMQWGAGGIENLSNAMASQKAKYLLAFNEPDFDEQSNIDANLAAQLWMQYIEPLKSTGIKLGGPAVSSSGTGMPWLQSFFSACSNCTIDFIPIHWYGEGVEGFYDYMWSIHTEFGNRTIWVTEYADTSLNATDVETFLNQTTAYMDTLDWVERYAWFGYFRPENGSAYNFLDADGGLNSLGRSYIGADTVVRSGPATNTAGAPIGGPTVNLATVSVDPGHAPTLLPNGAETLKMSGQIWAILILCIVDVLLFWVFLIVLLKPLTSTSNKSTPCDAHQRQLCPLSESRKSGDTERLPTRQVHHYRIQSLSWTTTRVTATNDSGFIAHFEDSHTEESLTLLRNAASTSQEILTMGNGDFLLPTFCDLHLHAPQFLYQGNGLHLPLMQWLDEYAFKAEEKMDADPVLARKVYTRLAERLIQAGTGSVLLFGTLKEETNLILAEVLQKSGIRGFVGKLSMDMSSRPSYVESSTSASLKNVRSFVDKVKKSVSHLEPHRRLVEPVLTPRFVPTCTDELLSGLGQLGKEQSLMIQSHLAEAHDQVEWVRKERGEEDIKVFGKHDLLTPRTIQAHCTFLDIPSLSHLHHYGTSVAHCPLSNAYFSTEPFRLREALDQGVKIGLGTDIAGGYSIDIMNAMRQSVIISRIRDGQRKDRDDPGSRCLTIDWKESLYLATRGGAIALGLHSHAGAFKVGVPFDAQHIRLYDSDNENGIGPLDFLDNDYGAGIAENMVEKWWCIGDDQNRMGMWVQGTKLHSISQ